MASRTTIVLPEIVSLAAIEQTAAAGAKRGPLLLDARGITWIGLHAASLLSVWLGTLSRRDITIQLPPRDALSAEVNRLLIGRGWLSRFLDSGIQLEYAVGPEDERGVGVSAVTQETDRASLLNTILSKITSQLGGAAGEAIASDITHTILFELLENAVIHASAKDVYFAVHITDARDVPSESDLDLPSHAAAGAYIDVVVGDAGPGLPAQLKPHVRDNYKPPFKTSHQFTEAERILSYAFEFGSTSDEAARRARLHKLLTTDVDPKSVATGLSCVLNIIRQRHGSLVIRTDDARLSVDYSRGWEGTAIIRGQRELGVKTLRSLPGTHFALRIPLQRLTIRRGSTRSFPISSITDNLRILDPWRGKSDRGEGTTLHEAVAAMSTHIEDYRHTHGLTFVRRAARPISSRAKALFGAALASCHRGERHIACLDNYFADFDRPHPDLGFSFLPPHESGSVLFGDLFRNEFHGVAWCGAPVPAYLGSPTDDHLELATPVLDRARSLYARAIAPELRDALRAPHIRLQGEFDIDHRYVTTVFYAVSRAIDDPRLRQKFAEWAIDAIPRSCEVIVVAAAPVLPLAQRLQELCAIMGRLPLGIVDISADENAAGGLFHSGAPAVILTDVICTTDTLRKQIPLLRSVKVVTVLTIVDARTSAAASDELDLPDLPRTPVVSAAREPLQPGPPEIPQREGQLFLLPDFAGITRVVIDSDTHRPTVYVRPVKTQLQTDEILNAAATSSALRYGHSEYVNRHYSVFLHLPRLFSALRAEIESWIRATVGSAAADRSSHWRVLVVATDSSLAWVPDYCFSILPDARIEEITWNHLRSPDPPRLDERVTDVLVIAPASASGELARRAIEYASRSEPARIAMLIVLARMEPSHLSFLTTLERFRESAVRVEFLGQFTIRAYQRGKASCPLCGNVARLERLRGPGTKLNTIDRIIDDRIAFVTALRVENDSPGFYFAANAADVLRTRIRALYEAAEFDHDAREHLRTLVSTDADARDRLIEAISYERLSDHFAVPILRRRLGSAFDLLSAHATNALWNLSPPSSLTWSLDGLIHLDEATFLRSAARLLEAFVESPRDIEDICIALLDLLHWPAMPASFFESLSRQPPRVADAVNATKAAIASRRNDRSIGDLLTRLNKVKTTLTRSSHFFDRLRRLANIGVEEANVHVLCRDLHEAWQSEIVPEVPFITKHPNWESLVRRHGQLAVTLEQLSASVAHLRALSDEANSEPSALHQRLRAVSTDALAASTAFADALGSLIINPLNSALSRIPDIFETASVAVSVQREIDFGIPPILCSMSGLNDVVHELTMNWYKFVDRPDPRLRLRVFRRDAYVTLAFEDNYHSSVDTASAGGWRMIKALCTDYGGDAHQERDGDWKSIRLIFRSAETVVSVET